jgi:zinc transport system ATP-binding protein
LTQLVRAGTALVVVLHEVGWLEGLLDRGIVLREGLVVYDGSLAELHRGADHRHHPEEPESGWLDGAMDR